MAQPDSQPEDPDASVYASLREYEEHFNGIQVEVKKLASVWMLAVFGAIAFIVRGDLTDGRSLLDNGLLLVIIGMGGNIGLLSLWILDQRVNQRLLNAAFSVGLLLERYNPNLPPIRSLMWVNSHCRGMGRYHALFYAGPMAFNVAAAAYGLAARADREWWLVAGAAIAAAAFVMPLGQWVMSLRSSPLREQSGAIRQTVRRWEERVAERGSDQP